MIVFNTSSRCRTSRISAVRAVAAEVHAAEVHAIAKAVDAVAAEVHAIATAVAVHAVAAEVHTVVHAGRGSTCRCARNSHKNPARRGMFASPCVPLHLQRAPA